MTFRLFEPFREWNYISSEEGLGKAPGYAILGGTRNAAGLLYIGPAAATGEIISRHEQAFAEFIAKQRSPEASWLYIIQLTEPCLSAESSPLQERFNIKG